MSQDNTKNSKKPINDSDTSENKRMEIEINKYKQLVEAINNPIILAKVMVVITVIVILIFLGISLVSLMLKKFYPYKSISTIQSGATIIQNEDTEVIYWLFNSADLWANSGIEVKEGDVITVRASGAFHTAIHHAVEDAQKNNMFRDDWILPTGGRRPLADKDSERMKYRIMPHANDNILLMQIIPNKYCNTGKDWIKDSDSATIGYRDGGMNYFGKGSFIGYQEGDMFHIGRDSSAVNIVIIGEEKRDIRILQNGTLHFAVNDIVLTERNINKLQKSVKIDYDMKKGYRDISSLELGPFPFPKTSQDLQNIIVYMSAPDNQNRIMSQRYDKNKPSLGIQICTLRAIQQKWDSLSTTDSLSATDNTNMKNIIEQNLTELDYYRINNFVDAWFEDNIGSILVAIERKKK